MFKKILTLSIIGGSLLYGQLAATPAQEKECSNIYSAIASHYLPVYQKELAQIQAEKEALAKEQEKKKKEDQDEKQSVDAKVEILSAAEQIQTILPLFAEAGDQANLALSSVFSTACWEDLDLLCGMVQDRHAYLANAWKRTITSAGDIVSKRILVQPTTDIQTLRARQNAIKTLLENQELTATIKNQLEAFAQAEAIAYSQWQTENPAFKAQLDNLYWSATSSSGTNPHLMELLVRGRNLQVILPLWQPLLIFAMMPTMEYFMPIIMKRLALPKVGHPLSDSEYQRRIDREIERDPSIKEIQQMFTPKSYADCWKNQFKGMKDLPTEIKKMKSFGEIFERPMLAYRGMTVIQGLLAIGMTTYQIYLNSSRESERLALYKYLQTNFIAVSTAIRSMQEIAIVAAQEPALAQAIHGTQHIDALAEATEELGKFIALIKTNTFKGEASFFSNTGRVLAAAKIFQSIKQHFIPAFEALGEVDAYVSMATLMKEYEAKDVRYCFVDFVDGADTPYMKIDGFWFPQLVHDPAINSGAKRIVTNSVEMGKSSTNPLPNILLTGPNMGGKSTILKGLVTCLLLAQSYGIAPAQSMTVTPFTKLQTYINIPDNAAMGVSLFKAQLNRTNELMATVKALKPREFSFTIFDEVFNGTSPEEAIMGTGSVIETLSKCPNSMTIIATHYGLLTECEKMSNGIFKNYKVTTIKNADGTFTFPYTWQPGISDQHIAMELIQQSGMVNQEQSQFQQALAEKINAQKRAQA